MTSLFMPVPQRQADLFAVDRLLALEPGRAEAVRNVPATLAIFDEHFPRMAVLPGVVILGCLSRLCEMLLAEATGRTWELAAAKRIRYRHFVRPGDEVLLTVELLESASDQAVCSGRAAVEGKSVTTVRGLVLQPWDEERP